MIDPRATYVDKPLSEQIIEWNPGGFIAGDLFPVVDVPQQGGGFYKWERADRFRLPITTLRAPGTEPRKADFRVGTDTYFCPNYALGGQWTREELKNADTREKYRTGKAQGVKGLLLLDFEFRVANQVLNTSNVGSYSTPGSLWSDPDGDGSGGWNSDPIGDIDGFIEIIRQGTGFEPNVCAMGKDVFKKLVNHGKIRNRILPHGTGGTIREDQLATLFGLDKLLIGGAQYNSAADDRTGFTLADIWAGQMLLAYVDPNAGLELPTYGKSFRWREEGFPEWTVSVHDWDSKKRAQDFDVGYYGQEKLIYTDLAYLVQSPIA